MPAKSSWTKSVAGLTPMKAVTALNNLEINKSSNFMTYCMLFNLVGLLFYGGVIISAATGTTPVGLQAQFVNAGNFFNTTTNLTQTIPNVWSTSSSVPGIPIPFLVVSGFICVCFNIWVIRICKDGEMKSMALGWGRGWFASGIYFLFQAVTLLMYSEKLVGLAAAFSSACLIFSMAVWIVLIRSRMMDIRDSNKMYWPIYFGAEVPHGIYFAASVLITLWLYFELGIVNGDLWFISAQDTLACVILCVHFVGIGGLLAALTVEPSVPVFNTLSMFFLGIIVPITFPLTRTAAFFAAAINVFYTIWSTMELVNLASETESGTKLKK